MHKRDKLYLGILESIVDQDTRDVLPDRRRRLETLAQFLRKELSQP